MGWGRAKLAADTVRTSPPFGAWSLICAGVAFGSALLSLWVATSVTVEPDGTPTDAGFGVFLIVFLIAAPILHVVGIVLGAIGLTRVGARASSVIGIVLNLALLGVGILLVWAGLKGAAAFT
ncbi:MAG: hypothetical protein KF723_21835 [Rhizobiaceae bacterium]|nr:hypothetical protein [Rhizobiaceae bacterium]